MESKDIKDVIQLISMFAYLGFIMWVLYQPRKSRMDLTNVDMQNTATEHQKTIWDKVSILAKITGATAALIYAVVQFVHLFTT